MCLACNFVLLHAQTIQMCRIEERRGRPGALGRQYMFEALAQAVVSPIVGKLMDISTKASGEPNYFVSFVGNNQLTSGSGTKKSRINILQLMMFFWH